MQKLFKNITVVVVVFLLISGLFVLYGKPEKAPKKVSLSSLVQQVNDNKVQEIKVDNDNLDIILKNGIKEKSTKEKSSGIVETLKNYGVDSQKLQAVSIDVQGESGMNFWLGTILPFLLPFLLIGAFIWFMLKQAQRGNSQALSFGASRARMTDPKDKNKKVTFKNVAGSKEA